MNPDLTSGLRKTFHFSCQCCSASGSDRTRRRAFLSAAVAAAATLGLGALTTPDAQAGTGHYDAMLLSCIDPRFPKLTLDHMNRRAMTGRYSQFNIAGAAIAAVAPRFSGWHQTFWDNLDASIQLHHIPAVLALNHRDCGAAKIAFGDAAVAHRDAETATHRRVLLTFRDEVGRRQPRLRVELGLMDLDGRVETVS